VGIIDGAPGAGQTVSAMRGFARGAPAASNPGSAVTSLLAGAGARDLRVADIYGTDPAGGNALALIRALDWLAGGGARVISISLGGPSNAAVAKAIAAVQRRGVVVVAAVGNDGPAAPPAYPASYPGVVAVTAVDGRGRALIEAGRAAHLDYAAPGADIAARNRAGKWTRVRGTSYAVPLVAARAAAALQRRGSWRSLLDAEAQDLGPRGPDAQYGRGVLCRDCARRP
jgi:subtilisin family serine protease